MAGIEVKFRPHWMNGWFLRLFSDPFTEVDGAETRCSWTSTTRLAATPGGHRVRTFVRYRWLFSGDLGADQAIVEVPDQGTVRVVAANGLTNHTPFTPRVQH